MRLEFGERAVHEWIVPRSLDPAHRAQDGGGLGAERAGDAAHRLPGGAVGEIGGDVALTPFRRAIERRRDETARGFQRFNFLHFCECPGR